LDILQNILLILAIITGIAFLGAMWLLAIGTAVFQAIRIVSDFRNTDNEEE
jgi:hypothetical protein